MKEYKWLDVNKELEFSALREIRKHTVEQIKESIKSNGFDDARVLLVIPNNNGKYIVAGGNHRLQALRELNIEKVACLIDNEGDLYKLAIQDNEAEKTFAPIDLFDYINILRKLESEGLNQVLIARRLNWSKQKISNYFQLLDKKVTKSLEFCKQYQEGRVTKESTNVTFNFTEGWFRNSGLFDLINKYQEKALQKAINGFKDIKSYVFKYKKWQDYIKIAEKELYNQEDLNRLIELIENDLFKNEKQLRNKIADFNRESKNQIINNDSCIALEEIEDSIIDIVITDPPYGIDYFSNRSEKEDHITKKGVIGDSKENALTILDKICEILNRKAKSDAHFYIFCSWKVEPDFRIIISKYFEIKNIIVWDKLNHGAGDLEGNWSERYELIIFATKGNRNVMKRKENIIQISKINWDKLIHPTQKPVELIKEILEASAQPNDLICDPFMGSGSTIKACIEFSNLNYIGIEIDKEIFESAKIFIKGD